MGCGERPPCGSRGGGPVSRPFARASASVRKRKVIMVRRFKKGFTLAELLIVIAIIAILVAVAVPVFSAQLEKARKAVDDSNLRIAKSVATTNYLSHGCVVSDCPGDCGTSHNSGCWYDTDSGRIYSDSVPPEKRL